MANLRRSYASASAAAVVTEAPASTSDSDLQSQATSPQQAYQIRAGVVLSRPPVITRDLHPFEKAYFFYQKRLNERLALPFTRYFYYQKGTPADIEEKRQVKERKTAARDIGAYTAYGKEGWNDEVLIGAKEPEMEDAVEKLLKEAEVPQVGEKGQKEMKEGVDRPPPRVTEADRSGDLKSLDRLLQRTLYLVVQNGEGNWRFPDARLVGRENLHQVGCPPLMSPSRLATTTTDHDASFANKLTLRTGRRTHSRPILRRQHEHLGRGQSAHRLFRRRIQRACPLERGGRVALGAGSMGLLHKGAHHGWTGEHQG